MTLTAKPRSAVFEVGCNIYDIGDWPEDVWETLKQFCKSFGFAPPQFRRGKGRAALWLMGLREINEAAAEFRADELVVEYGRKWIEYIHSHNGLTNRIIESPRSIVGAIAAEAARKRREGLMTTVRPDRQSGRVSR